MRNDESKQECRQQTEKRSRHGKSIVQLKVRVGQDGVSVSAE